MTDFVLKIHEIEPKAVNFSSITDIRNHRLNSYSKIINYTNFLKQPLELWMFVACDEKGNVLEEPINYSAYENELSREDYSYNFIDCVNFRQAKERVLFDVRLVYNDKGDTSLYVEEQLFGHAFYITMDGETTIEYLLEFTKTLELTPNAIKQLGL